MYSIVCSSIIWTLFYSTLVFSNFFPILFLFYSTLFNCILFYSMLNYFFKILFNWILLCSILFCSTLLYFILCYLLYILLYSTLPFSTRFNIKTCLWNIRGESCWTPEFVVTFGSVRTKEKRQTICWSGPLGLSALSEHKANILMCF